MINKLPDKWYVKATKGNESVLRNWRGGNHSGWRDDLVMLSDKFWGCTKFCEDYTEITFEQFKKWVLKETKSVYEVVHCTTQEEWDFAAKKINLKRFEDFTDVEKSKYNCIALTGEDCHGLIDSQKEGDKIYSFQEWCDKFGHKPDFNKLIKEWSVGSYVVFLISYGGHSKGTISKIIRDDENCVAVEHLFSYIKLSPYNLFKNTECKWFPTLKEAEEFSKSLQSPITPVDEISEYVECTECLRNTIVGKIYPVKNGRIVAENNYTSYSPTAGCFIPSTKEAYLAQQNQSTEWKPQVGEWVVTDNLYNEYGELYNGKVGQIWQIGKIFDEWCYPITSMSFIGGSLELHNLRKATPEEIASVTKSSVNPQLISVEVDKSQDIKPVITMSKEELLTEAKRRYPVGTKFISVTGKEVKITGTNFRFWDDGNLVVDKGSNNEGVNWTIHSSETNEWVDIVETPKIEVPTSNQPTHQVTTISYSYGIKETQQSNNQKGKKFSPIKAELINVKKLKIN